MLRENIGLPHRKHLYQIMANELKIPHVIVSLALSLIHISGVNRPQDASEFMKGNFGFASTLLDTCLLYTSRCV